MEIVVSNKASQPLYEQIASQVKAAIMSGELSAGEALPSKDAMYRHKIKTSIWKNNKRG